MDVFNKLYSTVSSTVSQLSTVLPGNPVTREYEATSQIASAGPGLLWKVYCGYKKSTNQEASIFLLEKSQLDRISKNDREAVMQQIRKGISQLSRLRHPQVLVVQHTLEESRDSLAFATEPVFASIANVLGNHDNIPEPVPPQLRKFEMFPVEIKYGLLQIAEGLAFLHNDAKLLHRNLCPQNILINKEGAWKIFGFDFSVTSVSNSEDNTTKWPSDPYRDTLHPWAQPDLDFMAPEFGLTGISFASGDIYSLGMIAYSLFNRNETLFANNSEYSRYKQNMAQLKHKVPDSGLMSIDKDVRETVRLMLNYNPDLRPDEHEFLKSRYFEDVGVKALSYLDSLFQWDNLQKSKFYKGLPQIIEKMPQRVCLFRIIPCLAKEFVNPTMVPFVLPSVFYIAERGTKDEFRINILPYLKQVMKLQEPIQILLICMQKMELLLKLTPADDVKQEVLPMLFRALESNSEQLQELCLSVLPTFASLIDFPAMKNALIPRIKKLCVSTNSTSVRVNCLVCIGKLMEYLDKWLILDDVLPFLPQVKSKEPAVLMSIIGIYKMVLSHKKISIPKEIMASNVLPFLIPLSIENSLTLSQFNAVMALIKEMLSLVESEHRAKLEQLNSIQEQQKNLEFQANDLTNGFGLKESSDGLVIENNDFEELFKPKTTNKNAYDFYDKQPDVQEKQRVLKPTEARLAPLAAPTWCPPTDLTSTLIAANLANMDASKLPKTSGYMASPMTLKTSSYSSSSMAPKISSYSSSSTVLKTSAYSTTSMAPITNTYCTPTMTSQQSAPPLGSAAFFKPLNAYQSSMGSVKTQGAKPLSSAEINDFLS